MNKKIVIIISIILILCITVGALLIFNNSDKNSINNKNNNSNETNNDANNQSGNNNEGDNMINGNDNSVVIYFSQTGTTKKIAGYISDITNSDMIEIVPMKEYTSDDLNYNNSNSRANKEQNDSNARPEIKNSIDVINYDIIYLGYPIWWGDVPKIILTFLDTYDLSGKTVIPFSTSHSSGISGSLNTLRNYNNKINWIEGQRFSANSSLEEVKSWLNSINN